VSQIYKPLTSSGPIPPIIPTTFTADTGSATPAANNLNVFSTLTGGTANNVRGVATSGAGATLNVVLTNRITGTATTTDAVTPVNLLTFPLGATPGTYLFRSYVTVFNVTDNLGATYSSLASVRTTGGAATLLTTGNFFVSEEGAMSALDVANDVSGNTLTIDVMGLAGKTIHYVALNEYTFVS
jgi:hypothetical protein